MVTSKQQGLSMMSLTRKRRYFISLILASFAALVAIGASPIQYPQTGLDPSWQQALVEATDSGRVFGRDIVFTYGPLHQAVTDQASRILGPFILGRILFSLAWFLAVLLISIGSGIWAASSIALSLALASGPNAGPPGDIPFYLFSLISIIATYTLSLNRKQGSRSTYNLALAIVFASGILLSTLVKLSYTGAAIPSLLVVVGFPALDLIKKRELGLLIHLLSVILVPFAALYVTWGTVMDWSPSHFFGYFHSLNLDVIKGYTDAMSYGPSRLSLSLAFIYWLSFASILYLFSNTIPNPSPSSFPNNSALKLKKLLIIASLLMLSWVVFKAAFVRDDGVHTVAGGLFLASFLIITIGFRRDDFVAAINSERRAYLISSYASPLIISGYLASISGYKPPVRIFHHLYKGLSDTVLLVTPEGRQQVAVRRRESLSAIANEVESYGIAAGSSADIVPWDITNLLANGLTYSPRPIPQSYSAYTQSLQKANKDLVSLSIRRPEFLVVDIKDIDGRLPVGLDSPLLLSLAKQYGYSHRGSEGSLIFRRRNELEATSANSANKCAAFSSGALNWIKDDKLRWNTQNIQLNPEDKGAIVLTANFKDSIWRFMLSTIYRPFPVFIEYLDRNGEVLESYRFVPKAAREIIVYPLIKDNDDFLNALNRSAPTSSISPPDEQIASIRISTMSIGSPFSSSDYYLSKICGN